MGKQILYTIRYVVYILFWAFLAFNCTEAIKAEDASQQPCIDKHVRRVLKLEPKTLLAEEVAIYVCKYLPPMWRDYAIAIGSVESHMRQINNEDITDFGVFQINIGEIKRNGYFIEMLETSVEYQILVMREVLRRKWRMCGRLYPKTWPACYNSATRENEKGVDIHMVYYKKFIRAYNKIRRMR